MEILSASIDWNAYINPIAKRFNREVGIQLGDPDWEIPADLRELPFWQESQQSAFRESLSVPFHTLRVPKKRERCLDIGCGVSFLIYPWTEWQAYFYGHDVSNRAVKFIQSRAPQLNSKLFKSMQEGRAHQMDIYDTDQFDFAIATGFLYYYPPEYFSIMWPQLRRVLKPKAPLIVEFANPDSDWADEWGLIELHKETEPILTPLKTWEMTIKQLGGQIRKQAMGELFVTYAIAMPG